MFRAIQKEHESCCPNCGCVLARVEINEQIENIPITSSVDMMLLGSALDKNVKYRYNRTRSDLYEERVLTHLQNICKKYNLPERLAIETFQIMQKKNRGFRSEYEYVKQLIKILEKDENYLHIHKMRAIKASYAKIINL